MRVMAQVFSDEMDILSDANVVEVGTGKSTTTDASGRFAIDVKDENAQLQISHVGYDYDTFPVNSGEIKQFGYVTLFPNTTLNDVDVPNKSKSSHTLLYFLGGLIAAFAASKIFGKSTVEPRKIKV